ncbi:MAG: hypothetical protein K6E47_11290 [Lachnospiraceae bacterium]|nr:hypothetical protein [Lachnospiraceae bacterium]
MKQREIEMLNCITERDYNVNKTRNGHRSYILLCLVLVLGLFVLTGCTTEEVSYINDAADYYEAGKYAEAEASFLKAIRNGDKSIAVFSGYAFNQLKAGDIEGAESLFGIMVNQDITYGNYFDKEPETGEAVRLSLLQIYISKNEYESAVSLLKQLGEKATDPKKAAEYKKDAALLAWRIADVYSEAELLSFVDDAIEAGNEDIKLYRMRANLNWEKEEWDLWEEDERKIIGMKDYAMEEYKAIYGMRLSVKSVSEVLSLIDEVVIYLNGHAAYIENYGEILPLILKGAEYSGRVEWEHDAQYYFDLAEKYISAAQDKNTSDNEILKYQIIIAEKKGKMELAYKLLGVYLEHCPDDRMAYKEQKYLENRIGVTSE